MFSNQSEIEFPNWWDDLDAKGESGHGGGADMPESGESELPRREDYPALSEEKSRGSQVGESIGTGYSLRSCGYDHEVIRAVWAFAEVVPGNDADLWRKDEFGSWIHRLDYGNRRSEFGWEVFDPGVGRHHQGIYAMRPMQWESYLRAYDFLGS